MKKNRHQRAANHIGIGIEEGQLTLTVNRRVIRVPSDYLKKILESHREDTSRRIHLVGLNSSSMTTAAQKGELSMKDVDEVTTLSPHHLIRIATFYANHTKELSLRGQE